MVMGWTELAAQCDVFAREHAKGVPAEEVCATCPRKDRCDRKVCIRLQARQIPEPKSDH